jgi:hypothetical protein
MVSPYREPVTPPDTTTDDDLPRADRRVTSALLWAGGLFHAAGACAMGVGLWFTTWSFSACLVRLSSTHASSAAGPGSLDLVLGMLAPALAWAYYRSAKTAGDDVFRAKNIRSVRRRALGLCVFAPLGVVLGAIVLVLLARPAVRARFTNDSDG